MFDMSGGAKAAKQALRRALDGGLGFLRTRRPFETADEAMDVAQDPEVSDQPTVESEDWSAIPPNMTPRGPDLEEFAPVVTMKAKLAKDLVPLFCEGEDVGRVVIERASNELHIADELLVAYELWA